MTDGTPRKDGNDEEHDPDEPDPNGVKMDGRAFIPFMAFGVPQWRSVLQHCAREAEKLLGGAD